MKDSDVEARLRFLAVRKAKPYLNREIPYPSNVADDVAGSIRLTLWDLGYLLSIEQLRTEGAREDQITRELEKVRPAERLIQSGNSSISEDLYYALLKDIQSEWEADPTLELLTERKSNVVREFDVLFRSNESQHRGFPHIVAVLHGIEVSISLEEQPRILAPKSPIRGSAGALRVIKKYRKKLIVEWNQTRPDDQKLL